MESGRPEIVTVGLSCAATDQLSTSCNAATSDLRIIKPDLRPGQEAEHRGDGRPELVGVMVNVTSAEILPSPDAKCCHMPVSQHFSKRTDF